jgi:hypothetical protein
MKLIKRGYKGVRWEEPGKGKGLLKETSEGAWG